MYTTKLLAPPTGIGIGVALVDPTVAVIVFIALVLALITFAAMNGSGIKRG